MPHKRSYILEFVRIGNQVKVTACDPESGTEAVVIVPANTTKKDMTDHAIRKLHYVMGKAEGPQD